MGHGCIEAGNSAYLVGMVVGIASTLLFQFFARHGLEISKKGE